MSWKLVENDSINTVSVKYILPRRSFVFYIWDGAIKSKRAWHLVYPVCLDFLEKTTDARGLLRRVWLPI